MRKLIPLAMVLTFALVASPAQARGHHRHHHYRHHHNHQTIESGRPADCYGIPWCGCWLRHVYGIADKTLNLARAWVHVGSPAAGPSDGVVVVWRHHVGRIVGRGPNGGWLVQSGNDGHAVRTRERSLAGVIAFRRV